MNKKEAIQAALDELLNMPKEEFDKMLEDARNDPFYGIFETLDKMSEVVYQEYNPDNYIHNMMAERSLYERI